MGSLFYQEDSSMTLEELKNISNEIKIRNISSQNMIQHCFIYNPTREMIICLEKMGITYQYQNDSSAYLFARFKRPDNEMISYMNLKIDINCDEKGFVSYTIFSANSDVGLGDTNYLDLQENEVIGMIKDNQFGYVLYEPINFFWSIWVPQSNFDFYPYKDIQMSTR